MTRERLIVYVDGFNLYHGLHDWARCRWLWLDLVQLAQKLRPRSDVRVVKYFTAPVVGQPDAASRQQTYQDALVARRGGRVSIFQGRYQSKKVKCRKCGRKFTNLEEKETDVNIAANIVADAASKHCEAMLVVSADSDLAPAIRIAQELNPALFIACAFPPERNSEELRKLLPASFGIGRRRIRESQLPKTVFEEGVGRVLGRPDKWGT